MRVVLGLGAVLVGVVALFGMAQETPETVVGQYVTPLSGRDSNQRHNAMLCLQKIDGVVIGPGESFSFNKTVGPWSRDQGYRRAPVSYSGQMIDAWGGGVCQTSTTVYNAALVGGLEVLERHAHHYAPTYVEPGRDAAVAFPNIDLMVRNPYESPLTLRGRLVGDRLEVWFEGRVKEPVRGEVSVRMLAAHRPQEVMVGRGGRSVVRNIGKPGFEVEVYREAGGKTELLSQDHYAVMNRVTELSPR